MRTTVDLPDDLLEQAWTQAARDGTTLDALLADGLRMRLANPGHPAVEERLAAVARAREIFTGTFPRDYLAKLRDEWPG